MRRLIAAAAVLTVLMAPLMAPVQAQETGVHTMHQTAPVGGKLCMTSHQHFGESPPVASAKAGRTLAIHKWQTFTSEEYGRVWGSYAASVGKIEKCVGQAPNMICSVESRPCKPLRK
jgi:hypothetical protein